MRTSLMAMLVLACTLLVFAGQAHAEERLENGFSTNATPSAAAVVAGTPVQISAQVLSAHQTRPVLVDIEIYGPNGARVFQQWFDDEQIPLGSRVAYVVEWVPPPGTALGQYTVRVGLFAPGWGQLLHWNPDAARINLIPFTGGPAATPAPPTPVASVPEPVVPPAAAPASPTPLASPTPTPATPTATPSPTPSPTSPPTGTASATSGQPTSPAIAARPVTETPADAGRASVDRQPAGEQPPGGAARDIRPVETEEEPPALLSTPVLGTGILLLTLLVAGIAIAGVRNGLARERRQVDEAWAEVQAQLERRHDLVSSLVEAVYDYMSFEQDVLADVTEAHAAAAETSARAGAAQQSWVENQLTAALRSLLAVAAGYPALRTKEHLLELQDELEYTENQIGFALQHYNATVMEYNNSLASFPNRLVAGPLGFRRREFFDLERTVDEAPAVPVP